MYKNILIATDGSELSRRAVDQGLTLAKAFDAKVITITTTEPWLATAPGEIAIAFPIEDYEKSVGVKAAAILAEVAAVAKQRGLSCETVHIKDEFPAEGILSTADERGCDLIVMGSHGRRGLSRLLLGSQANVVLTHVKIPVLICR